MVRVKICGITRERDALLAVSLGASAVGFIFYEKSPRYISPERARKIVEVLPPFVTAVGVFVNEDPERIKRAVSVSGVDVIQLHGDESPSECEEFAPRVIKALRVKGAEDIKKIEKYAGRVRAILLDAFVKGVPGGTGRTFDWKLALEAKRFGVPLILAGGISEENVGEAVRRVRPYGIDVSSGVEVAPGIKSEAKLKGFFKKLREAEGWR